MLKFSTLIFFLFSSCISRDTMDSEISGIYKSGNGDLISIAKFDTRPITSSNKLSLGIGILKRKSYML